MGNIETIKQELRNQLSSFRYQHSLMVASEAKKLAKHYNYDQDKAYLAGLVHDIAKEFTKEENEKWITIGNLPKKLLQEEFRNIVHADIGSIYLKEKYQLDQDLCKAVKYHTIGNIHMDLLAKIIFIADKIGRENLSKELLEIRNLSYQNLNLAIQKYLRYQKDKLEAKNIKMHEDSLHILKQGYE